MIFSLKNKKKAIICILSIFYLAGCYDIREINEIGFVMAAGVDKAKDSDKFVVTVQLANPKPIAAEKGKAAQGEPIWVLSAEGRTIFEAVRELSLVSSRRIVWGHNYIVIIGQSLAENNIGPVIDFFTHNPELRMKTAVVVSKGDAKPYVGSKAGMEDVPGTSLNNMVSNARLTAEYFESNMLQLSQQYFSELKQPILTAISFKKEKVMPNDGKAEQTIETVSVGGSAVFDKSKMLRMLTPEETRGFSWVFGKAHNTLVTVQYQNNNNAFASVEMKEVKSKISAEIKDGSPAILIKVTGKGEIVEEDSASSLPIEQFKEQIAALVSRRILKDIGTSVNIVQKELKVDSFSFAEVLHVQLHDEWNRSIAADWKNIYPIIPITVTAKVDLVGSTLNQEPARAPK